MVTLNIDFQDLPIAELGSFSSGTLLWYLTPRSANFFNSYGNFSDKKSYTTSDRITGVDPPVADFTLQKKAICVGGLGVYASS